MFPSTQPNLTANANVRPCRWLNYDTGAGLAIEAVDASKPLIGVSYEETRYPPGSAADDGFMAIAGESLPYHSFGQVCNVIAGAATTVNAMQTSDSSGRTIDAVLTTSASLYYVGGIALDAAGAANEKIRVWILPPFFLKTS